MKTANYPLPQPVGKAVPNWTQPPQPPRQSMTGRYCRLEPLNPAHHADDLYASNLMDQEGLNWTYLPYGPFDDPASFKHWLDQQATSSDPLFFAIIDQETGSAVGVASYLRITPGSGSIEVGHLNFSPRLQRTPAATEAMYLMMSKAFELGYRRYEWKCNVLNMPSRRAALRLGFSFEGIFRQATVVKGRNRDTAWYAVIDRDWPAIEQAMLQWLAPANFNAGGQQQLRLSELTAPLLDHTIPEPQLKEA